MIKKAKENSKNLKNISFYKASVEELPLANDYFDNIICTNSFHHYFNPKKVLSEIYRVLKPKGRIYIADGTADNFIVRWLEKNVFRKLEKEHVKLYDTKEYMQMFEEAGLQYLRSKIILSYPIKVHIAEK
jgi:SAM-dependent methyltransferase